jgi:hypothetical protein
MRELSELQQNPPEGIRIQTSDDNILDVTGIIEGPGEYTHWLSPSLMPQSLLEFYDG